MTNQRAIAILRWMNGLADGVPGGVCLRELEEALNLAVKALALDRVKVIEAAPCEP